MKNTGQTIISIIKTEERQKKKYEVLKVLKCGFFPYII